MVTTTAIVLAAVGGAVSAAAGIAVRHLWRKVTHLEAQMAPLIDDGTPRPETQV